MLYFPSYQSLKKKLSLLIKSTKKIRQLITMISMSGTYKYVQLGREIKKVIIANHHAYIHVGDPLTSHLGSSESLNLLQKVADNLRPFTESLIFCGDLNISKESPNLKPIAELGLRNLTIENNVPTTLSKVHHADVRDTVACDYILCSQNIEVKNFSVSDKIVSDHRALILEFEI